MLCVKLATTYGAAGPRLEGWLRFGFGRFPTADVAHQGIDLLVPQLRERRHDAPRPAAADGCAQITIIGDREKIRERERHANTAQAVIAMTGSAVLAVKRGAFVGGAGRPRHTHQDQQLEADCDSGVGAKMPSFHGKPSGLHG